MQRTTIIERRIMKETEYIQKNMPTYEFSYLKECDEYCYYINDCDGDTYYRYVKVITPNKNILIFKLPYDYPFKPPVYMKLNGHNYLHLMKQMPKRIEYLYNHPTEMYFQECSKTIKNCSANNSCCNCICCTSILCSENWSPAIMIYNILNQIENHNVLKRGIMYKLELKRLCDFKRIPVELMRTFYEYLE